MKHNVGSTDRVARVIVGAALLILTLLGQIGLWGLIGLVPLGTALFGFCPLYTLFGIRTCPLDRGQA